LLRSSVASGLLQKIGHQLGAHFANGMSQQAEEPSIAVRAQQFGINSSALSGLVETTVNVPSTQNARRRPSWVCKAGDRSAQRKTLLSVSRRNRSTGKRKGTGEQRCPPTPGTGCMQFSEVLQ